MDILELCVNLSLVKQGFLKFVKSKKLILTVKLSGLLLNGSGELWMKLGINATFSGFLGITPTLQVLKVGVRPCVELPSLPFQPFLAVRQESAGSSP